MYGQIPEPISMGAAERQLAVVSEATGETGERDGHVTLARECWTSIDRPRPG